MSEVGVSPWATVRMGLDNDRLVFQRCTQCGRAIYYPRSLCPGCGSLEVTYEESSGEGRLYSMTQVYERSGEFRWVVLVDLAEGFRVMSSLSSVEETVHIGDGVRWHPPTPESPFGWFQPEIEALQ